MKRKLSEIEAKLTEKNIKRLKEEKEYQEYLVRHATFMLTEGLMQNFKFQKREFEVKRRTAVEEVKQIDFCLLEAYRAIRDGVEEKEVDENAGRSTGGHIQARNN